MVKSPKMVWMRSMRGFALLLVVAVALILAGREISGRRLDARNVRHEADWFVSSLVAGNDRNTAMHLSISEMAPEDLSRRLVRHAVSILATDFKSAKLEFSRRENRKLATFHCLDGVKFTWISDANDGEKWRIGDLSE